MASRASDIWRLVCVQTWGLTGLPMEEPGYGGWRTSREKIILGGKWSA